jgi:phosphohistidine phosphatase
VLAAAGWPEGKSTVVIVGHQPTLGWVASKLLAGRELDWSVKKGAVWWFSTRERAGDEQVLLRAVISPDLL